jgi:hypothetical protein
MELEFGHEELGDEARDAAIIEGLRELETNGLGGGA